MMMMMKTVMVVVPKLKESVKRTESSFVMFPGTAALVHSVSICHDIPWQLLCSGTR